MAQHIARQFREMFVCTATLRHRWMANESNRTPCAPWRLPRTTNASNDSFSWHCVIYKSPPIYQTGPEHKPFSISLRVRPFFTTFSPSSPRLHWDWTMTEKFQWRSFFWESNWNGQQVTFRSDLNCVKSPVPRINLAFQFTDPAAIHKMRCNSWIFTREEKIALLSSSSQTT